MNLLKFRNQARSSLGQAAEALLPLAQASVFIPADATPSIPRAAVQEMYDVLVVVGRKLDAYAITNPEYRANVNTYLGHAGLIMSRAISGKWAPATLERNFQAVIGIAKDILDTPASWTAYIGPSLNERISGMGESLRSAAAALPAVIKTAAEKTLELAKKAARASGEIVRAQLGAIAIPLLITAGVVLTGLYLYAKAKK